MIPSTQDLAAAIGGWSRKTLVSCVTEAAAIADISKDQIMSAERTKDVSQARQGAMWLAHKRGVSTTAIARFFRRDWKTAHYGIEQAELRWKEAQ
ncbi:MAG: helix-turn-helix domain-containing protein [Pikeienuella sp.]